MAFSCLFFLTFCIIAMLRHGEWVGIFAAFDLILFQIDWLLSGVSVCLCNIFGLFWFFVNLSLLLLRVSTWKAIAYVLLNERSVPKISHWHLGLLVLIMPLLLSSCLPGSFQKEEN